jgi:hypothetical protein
MFISFLLNKFFDDLRLLTSTIVYIYMMMIIAHLEWVGSIQLGYNKTNSGD